MEHFHHTRRLQILLLPQESQQDAAAAGRVRAKPADIRLLSARKLISYIDGGGRMVIRQRLEAERPDIFLKARTVLALMPELERAAAQFPSVVSLSYAWVSPADPDPERAQLLALRNLLVWYLCERARQRRGYQHWD